MLGHVGDGLPGVVERAADVEPLPGRGPFTAQPEGASDRIEGAAELKGGRGHDDRPVAKHLVPHQHRHAHGCHLEHGATAGILADPGDVELALLQDPLGVLEDLVDRRAGDLPGTAVVLRRLRLQLGLHAAGGVPHPGQGEGQSIRYAVQPPLGQLLEDGREELGGIGDLVGLRETSGPLCGSGDHRRGQLVGDRGGNPVHQLMTLVNDQHVVLGQHLPTLEGVDRHEAVVGHDHVNILGGRTRQLYETLGDHRALLTQALVCRDRDLTPGPLGDSRHELVAVTGLGRLRPRPQSDHLGPQPRDVGVHRSHRQEAAFVIVGEAA